MKDIICSVLVVIVLCITSCEEKDNPIIRVETLGVTDITNTEAVCWGRITEEGSNGIKEYGIEVCFDSDEYQKIPHTIAWTDSFGVQLTGLKGDGSQYPYRAYVIEENGTMRHGMSSHFNTFVPEYFEAFPHQGEENSIIVTFSDTENLKEWGVYYNTTGSVSSGDPVVKSSSETDLVLTGLQPNTRYYLLPYAIDKNNITSYQDEVEQYTTCAPPELKMLTAEATSPTSGKVVFEIPYDGGGDITYCGLSYSIDGNIWIDTFCTYSDGSIEENLTGLIPAVTYRIHAFARNIHKKAFSDTLEFTTLGGLPVLSEATAVAQASYKVKMNAGVSDINHLSVTEYGFCWSTNPGEAIVTGSNYRKATTGSKDAFELSCFDLLAGTTYYVRAYAKNVLGIGYSNEIEVTTPGVVYGEVEDHWTPGKKYKTVTIGNQTWMAENLVFGGQEVFDISIIRSYIGDMCPTGWSVPTLDDWNELITEAGETNIAPIALRAINENYPATNSTGFSVIPNVTTTSVYSRFYTSTVSYYQYIQEGYYSASFRSDINKIGYVTTALKITDSTFPAHIRCLKD